MFANNEQISWRQLYCQMVLGMLGAMILFLPGMGRIYGLPGVVACILATVILALYCFWLVRIAPAYGHLEKSVGKVMMRLGGILFLAYFILTGAFLVSLIWRAISMYMAAEAAPWVIHLVVILACAMAGIPQIQRRGRMAEFTFPFLVGALLLMIVMAFVQQRGNFVDYLMQRTYMDVDSIFKDTYTILAACTCVGAVPFLLGNVKGRRYVGLFSGIGTLLLFLIVTVILLQGSYGSYQVESKEWPVLSVMTSIRIPGGFVSRMDPIWLSLLMLLLLFSVGSSFFYSNYIVKKTDLQVPWYVVYGLVYVVSLIQTRWGGIQDIYLMAVGVFFAPAIFLWNLFLGIKSRRKAHEK